MEKLQEDILELRKMKELLQGKTFEQRMEKIEKAKSFCKYLEDRKINYDVCIKHKEVLGCDDSAKYYERFSDYLPYDYTICKNLLVRERKGEKRTFLLITDSRKQLDMSGLKEELDCKKLEFVKEEEMQELLNTTPGNISLFNMIYDKNKKVNLVIDEELFYSQSLAFHPLYNGMSMFLKPEECLKFIKSINRDAEIISMPIKEEKGYEKSLAV